MKTEITEHTTGKLYHSAPNDANKKIAIWSEQEYGKVLIVTLDNTMYQAEANASRLVKAWNEYDKLKEENILLREHLKWLIDTVEREGVIDHITHEGMIEDCKNVLDKL